MGRVTPGGTLLAIVLAASASSGERRLDGERKAEARARADLARRLRATPEAIQVVEVAERTWPDERLGCHGRGMARDPLPVPGFRMVLALGHRRFVYHADRSGRILPCERPEKPIDRIR